jgi:hypothetical protein
MYIEYILRANALHEPNVLGDSAQTGPGRFADRARGMNRCL